MVVGAGGTVIVVGAVAAVVVGAPAVLAGAAVVVLRGGRGRGGCRGHGSFGSTGRLRGRITASGSEQDGARQEALPASIPGRGRLSCVPREQSYPPAALTGPVPAAH